MSNVRTTQFNETFRKTVNGVTRAVITIDAIFTEWEKYTSVNKVPFTSDAVGRIIIHLQSEFGFRHNSKGKTPNVSIDYDSRGELLAQLMDAFVYVASCGAIKLSRARYMDATRRCTHEEYYAQFAIGEVWANAKCQKESLMKSRKPHLCDHEYTNLKVFQGMRFNVGMDLLVLSSATTHVGYKAGITSSDLVCLYKAAARKVIAYEIKQGATKYTNLSKDVVLVENHWGFHLEVNDKPVSILEGSWPYQGEYPWRDIEFLKREIEGNLYLESNIKLIPNKDVHYESLQNQA